MTASTPNREETGRRASQVPRVTVPPLPLGGLSVAKRSWAIQLDRGNIGNSSADVVVVASVTRGSR